jgi:N4-gp56 family major capsid protein
MSINMTTTSQLPPAVRDYYDRLVLMTAYPALIHTRFAQHRKLPQKSGDQIVFRRYNRLATVPIALDDGITPPATPLSVNDIKARVQWYGNFVIITDQVQQTVQDEVLNQAARLLSENLAQTCDELTRDVLVSCSSVYECKYGSNGNTPTNMTKEDIETVVQNLLSNNALMISEVITGMDFFGTSPVRPAFWGMIDTDLLDDLESVSNFQNTANYPRQTILDNEWGSVGNVRFLMTSVGYVSGATPAVYSVPVVGKEAYAVVSLGSNMGEFYVHPLGSGGVSDPLAQRGSVGWKLPFVSRILNDAFMYVMLTTHS